MKSFIINTIKALVLEDNKNWSKLTNNSYYDEPLIGFASTDDLLFEEYKTIIGDAHLTPQEIFGAYFGKESYHGGTVISVVLPINEKLRKSNRPQRIRPSDEWIDFRAFEAGFFLKEISVSLERILNDIGYKTVAPSYSSLFKIFLEKDNIYSNWSERHIAYVAGLGTFSLNDGFITEKGMAINLVSVITELKLDPDSRNAKSITDNCLFCRKGTCGACVKRCPVGAITTSGHDKIKCRIYVYGEESKKYAVEHGGSDKVGSGCGLCFANVPCEFKIPK